MSQFIRFSHRVTLINLGILLVKNFDNFQVGRICFYTKDSGQNKEETFHICSIFLSSIFVWPKNIVLAARTWMPGIGWGLRGRTAFSLCPCSGFDGPEYPFNRNENFSQHVTICYLFFLFFLNTFLLGTKGLKKKDQ